ncbi:MAG: thioredoxin-dependent thiol peroxidase [Bacteroides sp.]|nr:thioredoxin-dependent thiol peroxidase [Bacteroides sp.]
MNVGDKVPDLLGLDAEGKEVRLSQFPGKRVILYFYPKDNTPGCTAEACSMRDHLYELEQEGFAVVGVSVDSAASHQKFAAKHGLDFPLVSDEEHKLVEQMGVWGEKKMAGRTYMGTLRTTFIISPEGIVERIYGPKQIKTKTHAEQLLSDVAPKGHAESSSAE